MCLCSQVGTPRPGAHMAIGESITYKYTSCPSFDAPASFVKTLEFIFFVFVLFHLRSVSHSREISLCDVTLPRPAKFG